MIIDLPSLDVDKIGIIREIKGGNHFVCKLQSMGIRMDKKIQKVNGGKTRGPQIIKIGNLQIAIGFGMAKHVLVEVVE